MKKTFAFVTIFIIIISLIFGLFASASYADNNYNPTNDPDEKFTAPLIPKAGNLPGPDKSMVEEEGARKILSERVLPKFAISTIGFVAGLSLLFLVIGGVRFAMAYGKEESVENAKKQVIYAIIGLILALLSFTIVNIVANIKLEDDTGNKTPKANEIKGVDVEPKMAA